MALQDAWELAQQLVNGGHSSTQAAVSHFADMAAPRSAEAIDKSHKIIGVVHSDGCLKLLIVGVASLIGFLTRQFAKLASFKPLDFSAFFQFSPGSKIVSNPRSGRGASAEVPQKRN